ncbi:MAG TPA: hypothetical protein VFI44_08905 [Ornithinibacter sp.]|nr:hypothetical protein [Ornithinibacter sp.]
MTADLEQRLRDVLHEDAERARLRNPQRPPELEPRDLTPDRRGRRGARWVAAAAVIAVLALVGVLTSVGDDDQDVEILPSAVPLPSTVVRVVPGVGQVLSGSGCPFGIAGEPVALQAGSVAGRFSTVGGQGVGHVLLGAQLAEVHVPGMASVVGGGREEAVELGRGAATVWLDGPVSASRPGAGNLPFVQARFFPDTDAPCSSFTVTVDGGSEEANRQAAVDLADRILLPADLAGLDLPGAEGGPVAGLELAGTEWAILVEPEEARMSFTDHRVTWDNGCATKSADYELDRERGILVLSNRLDVEGSCTTPSVARGPSTSSIIDEVMGSDQVSMNLIEGALHLGTGSDVLVLGSPEPASDIPPLPAPGVQPVDPAAAEEQVRAAFTGLFDASVPREERAQYVDRPEVWLPLNTALFESEYGEILRDLHAVVDDVAFTSPSHAAVRFELLASDERVPQAYYIGDARLLDGRWVVDVTTPCFTAAATGFECDFTP